MFTRSAYDPCFLHEDTYQSVSPGNWNLDPISSINFNNRYELGNINRTTQLTNGVPNTYTSPYALERGHDNSPSVINTNMPRPPISNTSRIDNGDNLSRNAGMDQFLHDLDYRVIANRAQIRNRERIAGFRPESLDNSHPNLHESFTIDIDRTPIANINPPAFHGHLRLTPEEKTFLIRRFRDSGCNDRRAPRALDAALKQFDNIGFHNRDAGIAKWNDYNQHMSKEDLYQFMLGNCRNIQYGPASAECKKLTGRDFNSNTPCPIRNRNSNRDRDYDRDHNIDRRESFTQDVIPYENGNFHPNISLTDDEKEYFRDRLRKDGYGDPDDIIRRAIEQFNQQLVLKGDRDEIARAQLRALSNCITREDLYQLLIHNNRNFVKNFNNECKERWGQFLPIDYRGLNEIPRPVNIEKPIIVEQPRPIVIQRPIYVQHRDNDRRDHDEHKYNNSSAYKSPSSSLKYKPYSYSNHIS
jgi:hypothetical protein